MDELRNQTKVERRTRAKAMFSVSEGIAKEREDLVHQLHHLKHVNKNMMDVKVPLKIVTNIYSMFYLLRETVYCVLQYYMHYLSLKCP